MIEASGPPVQPTLPSLPFLILAFSGSAPIPFPPLGSYLPYNVPGSASFSPHPYPGGPPGSPFLSQPYLNVPFSPKPSQGT